MKYTVVGESLPYKCSYLSLPFAIFTLLLTIFAMYYIYVYIYFALFYTYLNY